METASFAHKMSRTRNLTQEWLSIPIKSAETTSALAFTAPSMYIPFFPMLPLSVTFSAALAFAVGGAGAEERRFYIQHGARSRRKKEPFEAAGGWTLTGVKLRFPDATP